MECGRKKGKEILEIRQEKDNIEELKQEVLRPSGQLTEKESRKVSVFNMSRMFSPILGRSSLPPELGDRQRTNNSTGMSLKKVFQKRSV